MDGRPNILLVVLDTLRSESCSVCGYRRPTTPGLDRLAAEGTAYVNAISPAPWTLPAHVSLFTGRYCFQHRVDGRRYRLEADQAVLAEILRSEGYSTAGVSSNVWISDTFGFQRGFDFFHKAWLLIQSEIGGAEMFKVGPVARSRRVARLLSVLRTGNPKLMVNAAYAKLMANRRDGGSAAVSSTALRWLKNRGGSPFFLFLNYMDVHAPYLAPKSYRHTYASASLSTADMRRLAALSVRGKDYHMGRLTVTPQEFEHLRDLYDEEVLYTDARLAEVIDHLRQTGDLENTLIIVVSDHGENIGDHGLSNSIYEQSARCLAAIGLEIAPGIGILDIDRSIVFMLKYH